MSLYESNEETFAAASSDLDELLEASLTAQGLKAKDVLHYTLYAFYAKMTDGVLTPLAGYEAGSRSYAVMTAAGVQRELRYAGAAGAQSALV